jgi:hypothetical protein
MNMNASSNSSKQNHNIFDFQMKIPNICSEKTKNDLKVFPNQLNAVLVHFVNRRMVKIKNNRRKYVSTKGLG